MRLSPLISPSLMKSGRQPDIGIVYILGSGDDRNIADGIWTGIIVSSHHILT